MATKHTDKYSDGGPRGVVTRAQFVAAARAYDGTPFRHQGRTARGLDCAGLLVIAAGDCGMESWASEKHHGYDRIPDGHTVNEIMSALMDQLPNTDENLVPGYVVQIAYRSGRQEMVTHMGILTDMGGGVVGLIHAYFPKGKVVEHRLDEQWRAMITAIFRPRGLVG